MSESERVAKVRVLHFSDRPTFEVSVPGGTSLEKVFASSALIQAVRGIGPRGCETCLSGREFLVNLYDEVTRVEFEE
jgi:hypothetical protein